MTSSAEHMLKKNREYFNDIRNNGKVVFFGDIKLHAQKSKYAQLKKAMFYIYTV